MAAVGRARLKTESLINSQTSRALYGEAGEKDNILVSSNILIANREEYVTKLS